MTTTYKWHEAYKAALLETDGSKMAERIRLAESAIQERKREMGQADQRPEAARGMKANGAAA